MRRRLLPIYTVALTVLVVGALPIGVPDRSLAFGLLPVVTAIG